MARFSFLALSALVLGPAALPSAERVPAPNRSMAEGASAYQQGSLDAALAQWLEAASEYRAQGQGSRELEALMRVAGAHKRSADIGRPRLP